MFGVAVDYESIVIPYTRLLLHIINLCIANAQREAHSVPTQHKCHIRPHMCTSNGLLILQHAVLSYDTVRYLAVVVLPHGMPGRVGCSELEPAVL